MSYRDTVEQKMHGYNPRVLRDFIKAKLQFDETLAMVAREPHAHSHMIHIDVLRDCEDVTKEDCMEDIAAIAKDIEDIIDPAYEFDGIVIKETWVVRDPHLVAVKIDGDISLALRFASEPYASEEAVKAVFHGAGYDIIIGDVDMAEGQTWIKVLSDTAAYHVLSITGAQDDTAYIHGGYVYLQAVEPRDIKAACKNMDTQRALRNIMESDAPRKKEIARQVLAHDLFKYGGFTSSFANPDLPETFDGLNWHYVQDALPGCLSY